MKVFNISKFVVMLIGVSLVIFFEFSSYVELENKEQAYMDEVKSFLWSASESRQVEILKKLDEIERQLNQCEGVNNE